LDIDDPIQPFYGGPMKPDKASVEEQAAQLPHRERAQLALRLIASLDLDKTKTLTSFGWTKRSAVFASMTGVSHKQGMPRRQSLKSSVS